MTQPIELGAIRARCRAATPGPWYPQPNHGPDFVAAEAAGYEHGIGDLNFGNGAQADADREFVLNARQDMDALLARVRVLETRLDQRTADIADRALENSSLRAELSDRTAEARQLRTVATRAASLIDTGHTDEAATLLRHHADTQPQAGPPVLTGWAANMTAAGLTPYDGALTLDADDAPFIRLHFAFTNDMPDADREHFLLRFSRIILAEL